MHQIAIQHSDVLEHVMRVSADEVSLLAFVVAQPGSLAARAAVGRLAAHIAPPPPGSPLSCLVTGAAIDPNWRDHVTDSPSTLWGELMTLRALYGSSGATDPWAELQDLQDRASADFSV